MNTLLEKYDCFGFDLDNTLLEYEVTAMCELIYDLLSKFLVAQRNYSGEYLLMPISDNIDFLQKGLAIDFDRGNIVKLGNGGKVVKACHGSKPLLPREIVDAYGSNEIWDVGNHFFSDTLSAWNGPLSEKIRCVLDYFDIVCTLLFTRAVDTVDSSGNGGDYVQIWRDILDGLNDLYISDHFKIDKGGFFPALKQAPSTYIKKTPECVIKWLKELRSKGKFVFLMTGSAFDFASFTSCNALGEDWQALFDLVICFARKPGFFSGDRPFLSVDKQPCSIAAAGKVVTQGNFKELKAFLAKKTGVEKPKVLYVGDNVVQDVLAPVVTNCTDAVFICPEMEKTAKPIFSHSKTWGFYHEDSWCELIASRHAIATVPSLKHLVDNL